jgi:hypothetical protein
VAPAKGEMMAPRLIAFWLPWLPNRPHAGQGDGVCLGPIGRREGDQIFWPRVGRGPAAARVEGKVWDRAPPTIRGDFMRVRSGRIRCDISGRS